jgi:L-threonylcarbamoyladenylate synthase
VVRLTIDDSAPLDVQLEAAAAAIARGEVVAFPTDTLYGLAVDPRNEEALDRLFALKGREAHRTVALIAADRRQVEEHFVLSPVAGRLADRFWPGPLTLVLDPRSHLAPAVTGPDGRVGVRVPAHEVARRLARCCGHPVTATSANPSGSPPTTDPAEVARQLPAVAVLLDAGPAPGGAASTVVDAADAAPRLLRAGAVPWERVLESLGSTSFRP